MLRLIKLEIRKNEFGRFINGAIIAALIITALVLFIPFAEKLEGSIAFPNYIAAFAVIDAIVRATFVIFSAVIISKVIIEEYKNKTIMVMFMYPINRRKLIISKLILIAIFTFLSTALISVFVTTALCIYNSFTNIIADQLTTTMIFQRVTSIAINSLTTVGVGLIPLYFGMRKKSVSSTIVSSIIITTVLNSNNGTFSLWSILLIPLSLTIIGIFIAYLSIKNIENTDFV